MVVGTAVLAGHLCLWLLAGFDSPGNTDGGAVVLARTVALGAGSGTGPRQSAGT